MAVKRGGLGKGLDSLIPEGKTTIKEKEEKTGEQIVKISKIEPNREQPRKHFGEAELNELAESIKQFGVLQPLLVKKNGEYYEIIAGERRWRAAKLAGLKEVPVIIREYTEKEIVEIALIENIQRENLNPIEEALAYSRLMTEFNMKQEELANRVAKNRTTISNSIRLLKLGEKVRDMVAEGKLSAGHARALIDIEDSDLQYEIAMKIQQEQLSVRDVERLVRLIKNPKKVVEKEKIEKSVIYKDLEEKMIAIMGTKVNINQKTNSKGKIEIEYYSNGELERIFDLLMSITQN